MKRGGARGVLGVDSGGSGLRVALADAAAPGRTWSMESHTPVRTGEHGIDAGHLLEQLVPMARALLGRARHEAPSAPPGSVTDGPSEVTGTGRQDNHGADADPLSSDAGPTGIDTVAVGAAGMATLGDDVRARLPGALAQALGVRRIALAADAVTAYTGALGQRSGAVVAAGTGMIAVGTDLREWRRADGWGHLLGDCGGGAWIGRAGLEAALRAHDGRRGGSAALLARARDVFGPAAGLPSQVYPRPDRPAVLASFAPEVARCALEDPVAADVLRGAAAHIAEAAAAVAPRDGTGDLALTGGLFKLGEPLLGPLRAELAEQLPGVVPRPPAGDPLHGAVVIAAALALDALRLPRDGHMLHVPQMTHPGREAGS